MTVNKECFWKSATKDFSSVIKVIVPLSLILLLYIIRDTFIPLYTAYNLFIISESIVLISTFVLIATLNKETSKSSECSTGCIGVAIIQLSIFAIYCFGSIVTTTQGSTVYSVFNKPYPDVFPILAGAIIINLIITPLTLAYSRCKE
jgi:uncharacterized membrane protein